jgi:hypothetical protein
VTDKFAAYLHLADACAQPGCPVCRCLDDDGRRAVAAMLDERVTDVDTRRGLRAAWGLCGWHTAMVVEARGAVTGAAILAEDLLRVCGRRIQRLRDRRPSRAARWLRRLTTFPRGGRGRARPRLVERYRERAPCPVCAQVGPAEGTYLDTLVAFADDAELGDAYERSAGVCLPHLVAAVDRSPGEPGLAVTIDRTLRTWDALRRDLGRFLAGHEYRHHAPLAEGEATAPGRALEALAGRPHVFGHDLRRAVTSPASASVRA